MDFISVSVLFLVIQGIQGDCVSEQMTAVTTCFDKLKDNMATDNPTDAYDYLCSNSQRTDLACLISNFNKCPLFKNETFIDGLQQTDSGFHAKELFYVTSADEFCTCALKYTCMKQVKVEKLGSNLTAEVEKIYDEVKMGPWDKIANKEYICGTGLSNINCVAESLPACSVFIQYKHDEAVANDTETEIDVVNLKYASVFASKHCASHFNLSCPLKRMAWHSISVCHSQIQNLVNDTDKSCRLRYCIELEMSNCEPAGVMDFFIDAINVMSETKIGPESCPSSVAAILTSGIFITVISVFFLNILL